MPQQKITQREVELWRKEKPEKPYDMHDTEVKGFVARVRPSGTVTFLLKYDTITGKSRNYTIGRDGHDGYDATKARTEAEDLKHSIKKGADPQRQRNRTKGDKKQELERTLRVYFDNRYKPHHLKKRSEGGAKEAERILLKDFGHLFDKPLVEINTDDIENWQNSREGELDSETVRRIRAELESLYTHAFKETGKWKWLSVNPIAGLVPIKAKPPEDLKPRYLSDSESKKLTKAMRNRDSETRERAASGNTWRAERGYELKPALPEHYVDHLEVMIIVALKTGLRRNELFSLEWQDIEHDYSAINVRVKDAKIENFRWHDMRHDFASQLVIRNVSIEKVSKLLGHTDIKTTQRYAHLSTASLTEAVEVLS